MNMTKNGIPIADKRNRVQLGKPYRAVANPFTNYITLKRKEEGADVWLVQPFNQEEVDQLLVDGWFIAELWKIR